MTYQQRKQIYEYLQKTDYYDLLGVNKKSSVSDIKKSYRKLALKFHPDKNKIEGAKDVFRKISAAFAGLSDQENRKHYDYQQSKQQQTQNNFQKQQFYKSRGGQNYKKPEPNIFKPNHHNFQQKKSDYRKPQETTEKNKPHKNSQKSKFEYCFQGRKPEYNFPNKSSPPNYLKYNIFWIFIGVLLIYIFTRGGTNNFNQAYYEMKQSPQYQFRMATQTLKIPYFVRKQFFDFNPLAEFKSSIEKTIDRKYIKQLSRQCSKGIKIRDYLNDFESKKLNRKQLNFKKIHNIDSLRSCDRLHQIQTQYPGYIRDLFYY